MPLEESAYEIVRVHYRKMTTGFVFARAVVVAAYRLLTSGGQLALAFGGQMAATAEFDALAHVFEEEVDHRGGVEGKDLREQQASDDRDAQGLAQFRAGSDPEGQRDGAEQCRHRGHHDRAEADDAGFVDRLSGLIPSTRSASRAKSIIMMAFFLHDAHQENDADEGDQREVRAREQQRHQCPDARRGRVTRES
jgi:hypothetical protein